MKIEHEELFKAALSSGLNLFLGAGFSVCARNHSGATLPLGAELAKMLCKEFGLPDYYRDNLPNAARKIKANREVDLKAFFTKCYTVASWDARYRFLSHPSFSTVITINIDDLIEKVWNDEKIYFSDAEITGILDGASRAIYKLHGSVTYPISSKMLFSLQELTGEMMRDSSFFKAAQIKLFSRPTLVWGARLTDGNIVDLFNRMLKISRTGCELTEIVV